MLLSWVCKIPNRFSTIFGGMVWYLRGKKERKENEGNGQEK